MQTLKPNQLASVRTEEMARPARNLPAGDPAVRDYLNNLEARLINHVHRHAPRWLEREAREIHALWTAPAPHQSAASSTPATDLVREARSCAEDMVMGRVRRRLQHFHAIRLMRGVGDDPLGDRYRVAQGVDLLQRRGQRLK